MSKIEVDAIEPQSGTTLTIGASGDTITIPSGATLSSTDPLVFPAGTASAPAVTTTGDTNTGIFFPSADTIAFTEGGTEAMRIDSSGNVGIGITPVPPSGYNGLHVHATYPVVKLSATATGSGATDGFTVRIDSTPRVELWNYENSAMVFGTNNTERMRILSDGKVFIGSTTQSISSTQSGEIKSSGATGFAIINTTAANNPLTVYNEGAAGTRRLIQFSEGVGGGTVRGFISTDGSTVAYNTTSDYRLKENVNYNFDATTRLKQLKPARFNFITEPDKTVDGFLAHEVSDIIPEATTGIKNATETKEKVVVNIYGKIIDENIEQADWEVSKIPNEEGKSKYPVDSTWEASKVIPVYQAIDQAKLTPLLTKALQEAIARIESLEARLTALES
jgi:hypothetical protein